MHVITHSSKTRVLHVASASHHVCQGFLSGLTQHMRAHRLNARLREEVGPCSLPAFSPHSRFPVELTHVCPVVTCPHEPQPRVLDRPTLEGPAHERRREPWSHDLSCSWQVLGKGCSEERFARFQPLPTLQK